MTYTTKLQPGYVVLRSIYLGADAVRDGKLTPGSRITVVVEGTDISAQGTLNTQHGLSGMAKLYRALGLKAGDTISFSIPQPGGPVVLSTGGAAAPPPPQSTAPSETVFDRQKVKHIHIEPFRPENLDNWEPENETDIYLALGVLQEFTDFEYCCATSKSLLDRIGVVCTEKPDAILVDRVTDQYIIAELKKYSSTFKSNHRPEEIDVLVCWIDDETDRAKLPPRVVALAKVAKAAIAQRLESEDD